jgi:signal transduction histidine kinase/DNA-binding NarL/FixJ family response regulator
MLTVFAWAFSKSQIEEKLSTRFNNEAAYVVELVQERLQKYEDALWSGIAAIRAMSGDVSYPEWRTFADSLRIQDKYHGINGIGVIHQIPPSELDAYLERQRRERPDFRIHPPHTIDDHWPITLIEPVATNASAVGLDMAHEVNRYTAARKSRDTGTSQITGPIVLVQDSGKTPGFLFFAPFYRNGVHDTVEARRTNFIGLVYAPFIVKKLMLGTLEKTKRNVDIQIGDGASTLYDEHHPGEPNFDPKPLYSKNVDVDLYGRTWNFRISTTKSFRAGADASQPYYILATGIVIDTMMLLLFLSLARTKQRATELAEQMSEEHRKKSGELEQLFDQHRVLHQELEERNEMLEHASQVKSDFLATMSHELRTPLSGVMGMARLLHQTDLSPEQLKLVHTIEDSGDGLLLLLNDILDLSKIEAGQVELELLDFDLRDLLRTMEALWEPRYRDKGLKFSIDVGDDVSTVLKTDPTRLRQILFNLIGNATKFTEAGGITVRVSQRPLSGGCLETRVEVEDTGIGIPLKARPDIFSKFTQGDGSTTRKFGGTGLGLTICKQLTELLGGEIGFDSAEGVGTTFWFTIRCVPGDPAAVVGDATGQDGGNEHIDGPVRPLKILVAEDHMVNQAVIRTLLENAGHRVDTVGDGIQAVSAVMRVDYDLVLMDIQMPEMDGIAATQKIRELPGETGNLPIIALTANAMKGDREQYLAAGMSDYLPKPVSPTDLKRVIARWAPKGGQEPNGPNTENHTESPLEELPVLDRSVADELEQGLGAESMIKLMGQCADDIRASLTRLNELGGAADLDGIMRLAHDMKSSAGGFGAVRLQRCAEDLENACKEDRADEVHRFLSKIAPIAQGAVEVLDAEYRQRTGEAMREKLMVRAN